MYKIFNIFHPKSMCIQKLHKSFKVYKTAYKPEPAQISIYNSQLVKDSL